MVHPKELARDTCTWDRLLGLRSERGGEKGEGACGERASAHYWITSSARASTDGGIVRLSALGP